MNGPTTTPTTGGLVSIIMRTKDRPRLFHRAIDSVLAQTWPDWELVIVNDAGARAPIDSVVASLDSGSRSRVRIVHRAESTGMEAATNAGLSAAQGRYVVLLDDDDTWDAEFLATCVRKLQASHHPSVRGVVTHSTKVLERLDDEGGAVVERREAFTPSLRTVSLAALTQANQFPVNAFVYERRILDVIGGYREDLPVLGDWEFNLRFLRHFDVDVIPRALANYHVRPALAAGSYGNSPLAAHVEYDTRLRNEQLRVELSNGTPGLGMLAGLTAILDHRDHALARERDAARADAEQLARMLTRQRLEFHRQFLQRMVARICRAGIDTVILIGAGEVGTLASELLTRVGVRVVGVGDNDPNRWGGDWGEARVTSVDESLRQAAAAVVIASVAHEADLLHQVRTILKRRRARSRIFSPSR